MTAFATRALNQLSDVMDAAKMRAEIDDANAFRAVGLAYIEFALDKPAFFRAMWREEAIYANNESYVAATDKLSEHLKGGFLDTLRDDAPQDFSAQEQLAWSAVHGLASLFIDGPVARGRSKTHKLTLAADMIQAMAPALDLTSEN